MDSSAEFRGTVLGALKALSKERPIFHSEADFQHELATALRALEPSVRVYVERPVEGANGGYMSIDLLVLFGPATYAIELKYVKARLHHEEFQLTAQGATDHRRYDIAKDLARVESLIESGIASGGCSLTLTNEPKLWSAPTKTDAPDALFSLVHGGRLTGKLAWGDTAGAGTVRGRSTAISLRGDYELDWAPYSEVPGVKNGVFRSLALFAETRERVLAGE